MEVCSVKEARIRQEDSRFLFASTIHQCMCLQPTIALHFIITCTHANKTSHGLGQTTPWPATTLEIALVCFQLSSYPISWSNLVWFQSNSLATFSLSSLLHAWLLNLINFKHLANNFKSIILTSKSTYNINPLTFIKLKSSIKHNHGLNKHFIRSLEFILRISKILIHH